MQETQESWVGSLGWEDPLEEGMAIHSSLLAWKIPWTQEPSRLQFMGSQSWTPLKWLSTHLCIYLLNTALIIHIAGLQWKIKKLWQMVKNSQITALNSSYDSFPWFPIGGTHSTCQMRSPEPVRLSALGDLQNRWLLQNAAMHKEYKMPQYTKNRTRWSEFDRGWLQNFSNMGTKQLECKCSDRKKQKQKKHAAFLSLSLRQKDKEVRKTR